MDPLQHSKQDKVLAGGSPKAKGSSLSPILSESSKLDGIDPSQIKAISKEKQEANGGDSNEKHQQSHESDSFYRMYNKEIKINQDEIPIILSELSDAAFNFINRESYEKALVLLQKTEGVLEVVSLENSKRDKYIAFTTFNNMAMCFQKLGMLDECIVYLKECINMIQDSNFYKQKNAVIRLKKMRQECKLKLQLCAILSQNQNHLEALENAKKSVKLAHQQFFDIEELCTFYVNKINYKDQFLQSVLEDADPEEVLRIKQQLESLSPAKNVPHNILEDSISMIERTSMKMQPVLKELTKRMVGSKKLGDKQNSKDNKHSKSKDKDTSQNKEKKEEGGDSQKSKEDKNKDENDTQEEIEEADMRSVLGYLNQNEWIYNLNIGNIMQIQPLSMKEVLQQGRTEYEMSRDSFLEKLSVLIVTYFCVSTEMRFILQSRSQYLKPEVKKEREQESEYWHAKALELACTFLPSECPLLNHILLSYQKHHDPSHIPIKEDEEQKDNLSVLRPLKGIESSKYQPIIRQLNHLDILLTPVQMSPLMKCFENNPNTSLYGGVNAAQKPSMISAGMQAFHSQQSYHSQKQPKTEGETNQAVIQNLLQQNLNTNQDSNQNQQKSIDDLLQLANNDSKDNTTNNQQQNQDQQHNTDNLIDLSGGVQDNNVPVFDEKVKQEMTKQSSKVISDVDDLNQIQQQKNGEQLSFMDQNSQNQQRNSNPGQPQQFSHKDNLSNQGSQKQTEQILNNQEENFLKQSQGSMASSVRSSVYQKQIFDNILNDPKLDKQALLKHLVQNMDVIPSEFNGVVDEMMYNRKFSSDLDNMILDSDDKNNRRIIGKKQQQQMRRLEELNEQNVMNQELSNGNSQLLNQNMNLQQQLNDQQSDFNNESSNMSNNQFSSNQKLNQLQNQFLEGANQLKHNVAKKYESDIENNTSLLENAEDQLSSDINKRELKSFDHQMPQFMSQKNNKKQNQNQLTVEEKDITGGDLTDNQNKITNLITNSNHHNQSQSIKPSQTSSNARTHSKKLQGKKTGNATQKRKASSSYIGGVKANTGGYSTSTGVQNSTNNYNRKGHHTRNEMKINKMINKLDKQESQPQNDSMLQYEKKRQQYNQSELQFGTGTNDQDIISPSNIGIDLKIENSSANMPQHVTGTNKTQTQKNAKNKRGRKSSNSGSKGRNSSKSKENNSRSQSNKRNPINTSKKASSSYTRPSSSITNQTVHSNLRNRKQKGQVQQNGMLGGFANQAKKRSMQYNQQNALMMQQQDQSAIIGRNANNGVLPPSQIHQQVDLQDGQQMLQDGVNNSMMQAQQYQEGSANRVGKKRNTVLTKNGNTSQSNVFENGTKSRGGRSKSSEKKQHLRDPRYRSTSSSNSRSRSSGMHIKPLKQISSNSQIKSGINNLPHRHLKANHHQQSHGHISTSTQNKAYIKKSKLQSKHESGSSLGLISAANNRQFQSTVLQNQQTLKPKDKLQLKNADHSTNKKHSQSYSKRMTTIKHKQGNALSKQQQRNSSKNSNEKENSLSRHNLSVNNALSSNIMQLSNQFVHGQQQPQSGIKNMVLNQSDIDEPINQSSLIEMIQNQNDNLASQSHSNLKGSQGENQQYNRSLTDLQQQVLQNQQILMQLKSLNSDQKTANKIHKKQYKEDQETFQHNQIQGQNSNQNQVFGVRSKSQVAMQNMNNQNKGHNSNNIMQFQQPINLQISQSSVGGQQKHHKKKNQQQLYTNEHHNHSLQGGMSNYLSQGNLNMIQSQQKSMQKQLKLMNTASMISKKRTKDHNIGSGQQYNQTSGNSKERSKVYLQKEIDYLKNKMLEYKQIGSMGQLMNGKDPNNLSPSTLEKLSHQMSSKQQLLSSKENVIMKIVGQHNKTLPGRHSSETPPKKSVSQSSHNQTSKNISRSNKNKKILKQKIQANSKSKQSTGALNNQQFFQQDNMPLGLQVNNFHQHSVPPHDGNYSKDQLNLMQGHNNPLLAQNYSQSAISQNDMQMMHVNQQMPNFNVLHPQQNNHGGINQFQPSQNNSTFSMLQDQSSYEDPMLQQFKNQQNFIDIKNHGNSHNINLKSQIFNKNSKKDNMTMNMMLQQQQNYQSLQHESSQYTAQGDQHTVSMFDNEMDTHNQLSVNKQQILRPQSALSLAAAANGQSYGGKQGNLAMNRYQGQMPPNQLIANDIGGVQGQSNKYVKNNQNHQNFSVNTTESKQNKMMNQKINNYMTASYQGGISQLASANQPMQNLSSQGGVQGLQQMHNYSLQQPSTQSNNILDL